MSVLLKRSFLVAGAIAVAVLPSAATAVGGLSGPVFDVTTAPNGDLLVADASTGVVVVRDDAVRSVIPVPGAASAAPIGTSSMWVATGGFDPGADSGQALHRVSKGTSRMVANLFEYEATANPDGGLIDSNPYDVASLGGDAALVVDAGGNDLLHVDNQGNIELVATFPVELASTANFETLLCGFPGCTMGGIPPFIPAEPVPTSVAVGPDGAIYVGELKGFPGPTGESSVWRIEPGVSGVACGVDPGCSKVLTGFTSIVDLAFGPDGHLYVSELDELSWAAVEIFAVVTGGTVNACDLGSLTCGVVAGGIPVHTAITFDKHGGLWGTQHALTPGGAEVVPLP